MALIAAPATMTAWGWVLHRLNALYLRTLRAEPPRRRQTAWLKSLGTERGWREPSALIDLSMGLAVVAALLAFLVWCIFLGALGNGAAPGAW